MSEVEIEDKISKFWIAKCKVLNDAENEHLDTILKDMEDGKFINPCDGQPVTAARFVSWLDTDPLVEYFRNDYPKFNIMMRHRLPSRIRFFAFMCLSRMQDIMKAHRKLTENDAKILGFEHYPTYEMVREFINEILTVERFQEFFDLIIVQVRIELEKRKIILGKRAGQDATDVKSLKYDKEAQYSGYYKEYGYKCDITHDLDQQCLPLHYTTMGINDDEGKNVLPSQEHLKKLGFHPEEWKVDGKYANYMNIAGSAVSGITLVYKIQEGWVYNPDGKEKEINHRYQRHHNDNGFKVEVSLSYQLEFLYDRGEYECVGAYYRNKRMDYTKLNPIKASRETGERSGKTEGIIGTVKTGNILDRRPSRRGWKEFVRVCGLTFLAYAFAALIRVQHGVVEKIGNLTYIT